MTPFPSKLAGSFNGVNVLCKVTKLTCDFVSYRSDFIYDLFEMVLGSKAEGNKTMRKKPTVSSQFQVSLVGRGRRGQKLISCITCLKWS